MRRKVWAFNSRSHDWAVKTQAFATVFTTFYQDSSAMNGVKVCEKIKDFLRTGAGHSVRIILIGHSLFHLPDSKPGHIARPFSSSLKFCGSVWGLLKNNTRHGNCWLINREIKMAGHWPNSLFAYVGTETTWTGPLKTFLKNERGQFWLCKGCGTWCPYVASNKAHQGGPEKENADIFVPFLPIIYCCIFEILRGLNYYLSVQV